MVRGGGDLEGTGCDVFRMSSLDSYAASDALRYDFANCLATRKGSVSMEPSQFALPHLSFHQRSMSLHWHLETWQRALRMSVHRGWGRQDRF
jgi:hypothetical protein